MSLAEQPAWARPPARWCLLALGLAGLALAPWLAGCRGPLRAVPPRPPLARVAPDGDDSPEAPADPIARELLDAHNRLRAERDLPPLRLSPKLSEAAREHVAGMVELGKIRHRGADGSRPSDRVERAGYRYTSVGENVAAGQESIDEVMDGWMTSPGHRRNILGDFGELGAARGEDDRGRPYWCVVFGSPLPRLDPDEAAGGLLGLINTYRNEEDLPPLDADPTLGDLAREHARGMARAGSLDPPGPSLAMRLEQADVRYRRVAQSVASGSPGPEDVLDSMTRSTEQRRNLLGTFDRVGIGYATADDGRPYWTILLIESGGQGP